MPFNSHHTKQLPDPVFLSGATLSEAGRKQILISLLYVILIASVLSPAFFLPSALHNSSSPPLHKRQAGWLAERLPGATLSNEQHDWTGKQLQQQELLRAARLAGSCSAVSSRRRSNSSSSSSAPQEPTMRGSAPTPPSAPATKHPVGAQAAAGAGRAATATAKPAAAAAQLPAEQELCCCW